MKKTLSAVVAVLFAVATFAQTATAPAAQKVKPKQAKLSLEDRAKQGTDQLNSIVILTKEQYDNAYAINLEFQKARQQLTGGKGKKQLDEASTTKLNELVKEKNNKINGLLTPDQIKKKRAHHNEKNAKNKATSTPQKTEE